ncbi:MAG: protein translocase subunit SecD, partial [Proteobacteria bacterium]|nr:protein translocase subunit SecD [Pseudomonadota bacterium]
MEGTNWFRLSLILAMFFGAIYILLPTILQEDAQSRFAQSAQEVGGVGELKKAVLELEFLVDQDDTEPIAEILRQRYELANVKLDRVVAEKGRIVVKMRPATERSDVVNLAVRMGKRVLYNPNDLVVEGEIELGSEPNLVALSKGVSDALVSVDADVVVWSQHLPEMAGDKVPAGKTALAPQVDKIQKDTFAATLSAPLPEDLKFAILSVDGEVAGLVTQDLYIPLGKPKSGVKGFHFDAYADVLLVSGPLPIPLEFVEKDVDELIEVEFNVDQEATQPVADFMQLRYELGNVKTESIVADKNKIVVTIRRAALRTEVVALARQGERLLYNPDDIATSKKGRGDLSLLSPGVPEALISVGADVTAWVKPLPKIAGSQVPEGIAPLATKVEKVKKGSLDITLSEPLPSNVKFAIVALDGEVVGLATPKKFVPLGKPKSGIKGFYYKPSAEALLVSGPMSARVEEVVEQTIEETPSAIPTWVLGLLPNTRMNLGLDLQGGIDITLQVGLDDAVLSQATRDMLFVKERAAREGLNIHDVRRDRSEPIVLMKTDENIDILKDFVRKQLPDYIYVYSDEDEHGFEMSDSRVAQVQKSAVEQVLETLRKRIDATGTKEPSIYKKGGGAINVQLPGETNLEVALAAIRTAAVLEFRMGVKDYDESILEKHVNAAEKTLHEEVYHDDNLLNEWMWDEKRLDADRILLWEYEEQADGTKIRSPMPFVAENKVMLTGNDINDAMVSYDQNNQPYVRLEFKPRGGSIFCDISSAHVNEQFAIILDDELISAPVIRDRICGGVASIEMGASADPLTESNNLSLVLRTGSLDAPVVIGNIRTVGSTLGEDSIRAGSIATVVGSLIVLVFMALWYGKAGLVADMALTLNVMLAMAILGMFGATLTLPGIAGIALTIGMAVDANIIIYERIREELALGVHARKAVDTGFEKGLVAVLDANITTAIAGVVLFSYGT